MQWDATRNSPCLIDPVEAHCFNDMLGVSCACPQLQSSGGGASNCGPSTSCGAALGSLSAVCEQRSNNDPSSPNSLYNMQVTCGVTPKYTPPTPAPSPTASAGSIASLSTAGIFGLLLCLAQ
jgi:hypothetical protein